jgi:hypothetical protein
MPQSIAESPNSASMRRRQLTYSSEWRKPIRKAGILIPTPRCFDSHLGCEMCGGGFTLLRG